MKAKTLLEAIGWDKSDLDQHSGTFVTIGVHDSQVCFESRNKEKVVLFAQVIKVGDKLKFPEAFKFLRGSAPSNPLLNLLDKIFEVIEQLLTLISKHKILNLMEDSLAKFKNPSENIADFPFNEWLIVGYLDCNFLLAQVTGKLPSIVLKNPKDGLVWALDFPVFSHVTLIEYEEGEGDRSD